MIFEERIEMAVKDKALLLSYDNGTLWENIMNMKELKEIATLSNDTIKFTHDHVWVEIHNSLAPIKFDNVFNFDISAAAPNEALKSVPETVKNRIMITSTKIDSLSNLNSHSNNLLVGSNAVSSLDGLSGRYKELEIYKNTNFERLGGDKTVHAGLLNITSERRFSARNNINVTDKIRVKCKSYIDHVLNFMLFDDNCTFSNFEMDGHDILHLFAESDDIYDLAAKLIDLGYPDEVVSV